MTVREVPLGELCSIRTGTPIARAKRPLPGAEPVKTHVLAIRATLDGRIIDQELAVEDVYQARPEHYTLAGDVVLKCSTPYDSVYIDRSHQGLLVTSFSVILRPLGYCGLSMRYLAVFLNRPDTIELMRGMSKGNSISLLKKRDLVSLPIPMIPWDEQLRLAHLYDNVQARREQCLRMIDLGDQLLMSELEKAISQ